MSRRPCRSCGVELIFAKTADGKTVPVDARQHPIYRIVATGGGNYLAERIESARISHFVTCPNATEHSRKEPKP